MIDVSKWFDLPMRINPEYLTMARVVDFDTGTHAFEILIFNHGFQSKIYDSKNDAEYAMFDFLERIDRES